MSFICLAYYFLGDYFLSPASLFGAESVEAYFKYF